MSALLKNDLLLLSLGALALYVVARNAGSIGGGAVTAATEGITAAGAAINDRIINPAVRKLTGDEDATLGGKVWEWLHPQGAYELKHGMPTDGRLAADPFEFG